MIHETVITTRSPEGAVHITPMGVRRPAARVVLAPFRPSRTLDNVLATGQAVVNMTDDVLVVAGCLTGRTEWPLVPARRVEGARLACALAHEELEVESVDEADPDRPRILCRIVHGATHAPFRGFNRAQAAVIEAAILVSRLHMLPAEKVDREMAYLEIAVEKTAGERERQAWDWLVERIRRHRDGDATRGDAA